MEVFAILSVTSSQMSADEISEQVGVLFDNCWSAGEFREKTKIMEKTNGCRIVHHMESVDDIQIPVDELLKKISGNEERLKSVAESCEILVRCAVYTKDAPALYFNDDLLHKLASIKTSFDIDLYLI